MKCCAQRGKACLLRRSACVVREGGFSCSRPARASASPARTGFATSTGNLATIFAARPGQRQSGLDPHRQRKTLCGRFCMVRRRGAYRRGDASLEEALPARLERYAVSDDVAFDLLPPDPQRCHVFGPVSAGKEGLRIRRLGVEGVDVAVSTATICQKQDVTRSNCCGSSGAPALGQRTLRGDASSGSRARSNRGGFQKGCYVGQEVVSRIHSVGRVNRHLCGFVGDFDPSRAGAATLVAPGGQRSGRLTSAAYHPDPMRKTVALGFSRAIRRRRRSPSRTKVVLALARAERSQFPLLS